MTVTPTPHPHAAIAAVLDGQDPAVTRTALVAAVAYWLRQYHPADPTVANWLINEMRSALLSRFLKAVAAEIGTECGVGLQQNPHSAHAASRRQGYGMENCTVSPAPGTQKREKMGGSETGDGTEVLGE